MRTKVLGRTGIEVPILGLGTAFLGDPVAPGTGAMFSLVERDAADAVREALRTGPTLIDTAPLYGDTKAEVVIGQVLREEPELAAHCVVTTKVGRKVEGKDYSAKAVRASVLRSQESLGLEQLPLVCIHDTNDHPMAEVMADDGAYGALRRLKDEGVVGFIGTATSDLEINAGYVETGLFDAVIVTFAYSLLNQSMLDRVGPAAEKFDMGIMTAATLERGLLATGPVEGAVYQSRRFSPAVTEHVRGIQNLCADHGISLLAAALQWPSQHPQVATALAGARTKDEVRQNVDAGSTDIPDQFWTDLAPMIRHWGPPDITR
jgi:D-threo-aldose 1-dehydrogenase